MDGPYHAPTHTRALLRSAFRHVRDWSRHGSYRALYRFRRQLRRLPRGTSGSVVYHGRPIQFVDAPSFLSAWDEIFVNRIYDIDPKAPTPLLVDVGANIGLAALFWKTRFSEFRYLGFEADPAIAAVCRQNLSTWDCQGTLHATAVATVDGPATFMPDRADGGRIVSGPPSGNSIEVETQRLSRFLDQPVDLLKIDIEGAEADVLREAASSLPNVRNLFVEVHCRKGSPQQMPQILAMLNEAGFRTYVHPLLTPSQPFISLNGTAAGDFDQLVNVFGVRP